MAKGSSRLSFIIVKPPRDPAITLDERTASVLCLIEREGLCPRIVKSQIISKDLAEELYRDHRGRSYFPHLVRFMTARCIIILVEGADADVRLRKLAGPTYPAVAREIAPRSIRALLGDPAETKERSIAENRVIDNVVHTPNPDEPGAVQREGALFFSAFFQTADILAFSSE